MHPGLMPRHRPTRTPIRAPGTPHRRLCALLTHPRLIIAWRGSFVILMAGPRELTIHVPSHPHVIDLIRRTA